MANTRITDLLDAVSVSGNDLLVVLDTTTTPPTAKSVAASYIATLAPVASVAGKVGAVTLTQSDISGLPAALAGRLDADNYISFTWATRTITGVVSNYLAQPANMLRLNTIGAATITGFSGGAAHTWHRIINVSLNNITVVPQSAQSEAANRIVLPGNTARVIYPNQDAIFFYDPTIQRWRSPGCPVNYGY
jgi:hypothetical protein